MSTIKNVFFPTDFSENSINALPYAVDVVKKNKGKLSLLNVYEASLMSQIYSFMTRKENMVDTEENTRIGALDKLKQIIIDNNLSKFKHRCFVREGNVRNQIKKIIQRNSIELIVMGTKAGNPNNGLLNGSITKSIIQYVSCPVLAIPEGASFNNISKIVYATDLQHNETKMINYLINFAKMYKATVVILHIDINSTNKNWSIEALKKIVDKTTYSRIAYNELVVEDVAKGINEYTIEHKTDMLAMTTHVATLLDKIFHKSITEQLLLKTNIPLLAFHTEKNNGFLRDNFIS